MTTRKLKHPVRAILLFLALTALLAACNGADDPAPTPSAAATSSPEPTPSPTEKPPVLPPLTPFGRELAAKLHTIRDRVAQIRGLPVPELAQEGVATPEDVAKANLESVEDISPEDQADSDAFLLAAKMLRLVPEDYSMEAYTEDYSSNIAGFYSVETNTLVVIGEPDASISPFDEMVLAHEYTHALQDAAFKLDELQDKFTDYPDDEAGRTAHAKTLHCLIEGDAVVTEYTYMNEVYGPDWFTQIEYPSGVGDNGSFPEFLARDFAFNYNECYYFVLGLYNSGGWEAVNEAFANPPATTEQVLHPEKYEAGEVSNGMMPDDLTRGFLPDWTVSDLGQFGEYDIQNYVLSITGDYDLASAAGTGWGSGWWRVYTSDEGARVFQFYLSFDSSADLSEFFNAFTSVLREYDVDTDAFPETGARHFTIPGTPPYYGAIGQPHGAQAAEIIIATDEASLQAADRHLQ